MGYFDDIEPLFHNTPKQKLLNKVFFSWVALTFGLGILVQLALFFLVIYKGVVYFQH